MKFITFDAAVLIYKQTILPIIDHAGFMLIACNSEAKENMQILQNDILRICCRYKRSDNISIEPFHKECKILSLEQRMRKQLLCLMFLLSKKTKYQRVTIRDTWSATKIHFKVPNKISHTYKHLPYYIGTKLWNGVSETVQNSENSFIFKIEVATFYKTYSSLT